MSRLFYHVMQDHLGNLLFDVSGTMRLAGTGTAATIYGDEALTVILPNPMTNHPSYGSFKCFLGAGDYDFYMAKPGYSFETLTGVQGHGTMAQQDADDVYITGGVAQLTQLGLSVGATAEHVLDTIAGGLSQFNGPVGLSAAPTPGHAVDIGGIAQLMGYLGIGGAPSVGVIQTIFHNKTNAVALEIRPTVSDGGAGVALAFNNIAGTQVGNIFCTAGATAYNTTSDVRLKEAIEPLDGGLDVIRALNPVSFCWKTDGTMGRGLLAHEVAEVVDGVVTGAKDAVDQQGQMLAQQIDYSKLVPYLIGAVKELTQQVEMLTAKLAGA